MAGCGGLEGGVLARNPVTMGSALQLCPRISTSGSAAIQPERRFMSDISEDKNINITPHCGSCRHFGEPSAGDEGICYGEPPSVNSSGFMFERKVRRLRQGCHLHQTRKQREAAYSTQAAALADGAPEAARSLTGTKAAQVTGSPAGTADLQGNKKSLGGKHGRR